MKAASPVHNEIPVFRGDFAKRPPPSRPLATPPRMLPRGVAGGPGGGEGRGAVMRVVAGFGAGAQYPHFTPGITSASPRFFFDFPDFPPPSSLSLVRPSSVRRLCPLVCPSSAVSSTRVWCVGECPRKEVGGLFWFEFVVGHETWGRIRRQLQCFRGRVRVTQASDSFEFPSTRSSLRAFKV